MPWYPTYCFVLQLTECTIPDRNMLGTSKVATNIVEIKGKEIPLVFADASRPSVSRPAEVDGADEIDPEIMEMLNEEAVDGFDEGGDLEDNFLELAGGVDLPEGRRIYEEFRRATGPELSDSEIDEDDVMSGGDIGDEEMINGKVFHLQPVPGSLQNSSKFLQHDEPLTLHVVEHSVFQITCQSLILFSRMQHRYPWKRRS